MFLFPAHRMLDRGALEYGAADNVLLLFELIPLSDHLSQSDAQQKLPFLLLNGIYHIFISTDVINVSI